MKKETVKKLFGGVFIGLVNGLFGAGGGILAVPVLRHGGMEDKKAHASSVAVILPISLFSLVLYLLEGRFQFSEGLPYILWGVAGSVLGTKFLQKISGMWLHRVFGGLIIFAGVRFIMG